MRDRIRTIALALRIGSASGEYQCDVILLVARAQGAYFVRDSFYGSLAGLVAIMAKPLNQVSLTKLFTTVIYGFGNAIRVKGEQVSRRECDIGELALPILEKTYQSCCGVEPAHGVVRAQNKAREMAAVSVMKAACFCVVVSEKQRGVSAFDGIPVEQLVDRTQKEFRLRQDEGALAAQVGLQIGHEQGSGDPFPRDISDHESEALLPEIEKVKVVSADLASLAAQTGIFKCLHLRMHLGEEASLHLPGDLNFLSGAALGLIFLSQRPPFGLHAACEFVESCKAERVPIRVFKARVNAAPGRDLRWETEANAARHPLLILAVHVFGYEPDARFLADE